MPPTKRLADVDFEPRKIALPAGVVELLKDAGERIDALEDKSRAEMPAFVPSNFEVVYSALAEIYATNLATGRRFIEWGSGVGVVACLASYIGFDSVGIEIEPKLVEIAKSIAERHDAAVDFICGSFVPDGVEANADWNDGVAWLTTDAPAGYDDLGLDPDDFDLVFAYPWPGEEQVIFDLFATCAATGALLLTFHGLEGLQLKRKMRR